jgi:hypothetical protein
LPDIAADLANDGAAGTVLGEHAEPPGEPPLAPYRAGIDATFSADTVEEILSRLDDLGAGGRETARQMRTRSPTSLKLTLQQLRHSWGRPLTDCLQTEYQIAAHILRGHDFYEGVRAAVVDKDHKPAWQPASLAEVSEASIDAYFQPIAPPLAL